MLKAMVMKSVLSEVNKCVLTTTGAMFNHCYHLYIAPVAGHEGQAVRKLEGQPMMH